MISKHNFDPRSSYYSCSASIISLQHLSLSHIEADEFFIEGVPEKSNKGSFDLCLVGRFLIDRSINFHIMREIGQSTKTGKGGFHEGN